MDVNLYVIQYSAISSTLVEAEAVTLYDRLNLCIDGLPNAIQKKLSDHAAEERWKLFADDLEGSSIGFETLKSYVNVMVKSELKRKILEQERVTRNINRSFHVKKPP